MQKQRNPPKGEEQTPEVALEAITTSGALAGTYTIAVNTVTMELIASSRPETVGVAPNPTVTTSEIATASIALAPSISEQKIKRARPHISSGGRPDGHRCYPISDIGLPKNADNVRLLFKGGQIFKETL